jgi:hypothetical protein
MNRSIALFVALAVLVAHAFAIYYDESGVLAPPADAAYVAFRLGRSLAYLGQLVWNPGQPGFDSHPSLLWVGVCALVERLYWPINSAAQFLGATCSLATLVLVSRFQPTRIATLIAPLLLAASGGMAAAAVSGTEIPALTMLLAWAFLAFEKGRDRSLSITLLLAGLTRPEAWPFGAALFLIRWQEGRGRRAAPEQSPAPASLRPFLLPLVGCLLVHLWRFAISGQLFSSHGAGILSLGPGEIAAGLAYLRDFLVTTASPILLLFALGTLARGRLSRTGRRALALHLLWIAIITIEGGGAPTFAASLLPGLPLALIAAQEGMIEALDSPGRAWRSLAWTGFLLAFAGSAFASTQQRTWSELSLAQVHERWSEPAFPPRYGYRDRLGRSGLQEEIAVTARLRAVGVFLRDGVDPDRSVLTAWPGAIAYLSRLRVLDLLGRTDPIEPGGRNRSWVERSRIDLPASLERRADYLVPFNRHPGVAPSAEELARTWLAALDRAPEEPGRLDRVLEALLSYQLVAVPIEIEGSLGSGMPTAHYLLRRRELGLAPRLRLRLDGDHFAVELRHDGHLELADLRVQAIDAEGRVHHLEPTGSFRPQRVFSARAFLLVHPTGDRSVELMRARLPEALPPFVSLHAVLLTPGAQEEHSWSFASEEVVLPLR